MKFIDTSVDELIPDPENARIHNNDNLEVIAESLREFGAARSIVVDKNGIVRAGNGTLEAAKRIGLKKVRVVEATGDELIAVMRSDLTDVQAKAYSLVDNRATDMSDWNISNLKQSLVDLKETDIDLNSLGFDEKFLEKLLLDLNVGSGENEDTETEDINIDKDEVFALREDSLFTSSNKYGIPDLLPEMLAGVDCVPLGIWDGLDLDFKNKLALWTKFRTDSDLTDSIIGFYVDDYKFESVWIDAVRIMEQLKSKNLKAIIEPDFSVWRDSPMACQLWNRYRSQWVARYWQAIGFKVIPSLNWSDENSYDFCCAGVPIGCELVSLQCRTTQSRKGKEFFIKGINNTLERLKPMNIMIYGGDSHRSWIEPNLKTGLIKGEIFWLDDWTTIRMNKRSKNV